MAAGIRAKSRGFEKKINFVKNIREALAAEGVEVRNLAER